MDRDSMSEPIEATALPDWDESDRRTVWLFEIVFSSIFAVVLISGLYYGGISLISIMSTLFLILTVSFIITGLLAFKHHHRRGMISTKRVLKWFAAISFCSAIDATVPLYVLISADAQDSTRVLISTVSVYMSMVLAIFLILLLFMLAGFGVFGLLFALQRRYTAGYLVKVKDITSRTRSTSKKKGGIEYRGLQWLFAIPDVLDSDSLTFDEVKPRKQFPLKVFGVALLLEVFFSAILSVYVSLNPFLFEMGGFQELFSLSSSLSIFIPIFIIPWFLYLRLNARIRGPVKDFKLFDGIQSRMLGSLAIFGTLIVFIRYALRDIDAWLILGSFALFYFFFIIVSVVFTFVYFNYFEDDLAMTVARDYQELTNEPA